MAAIDKRQYGWYDNLTDEERKGLSMWVLMRYCSSTGSRVNDINEFYLTMTNELVNVYFNDLRHDPELQLRLMQCVGIGTDQFHPWIKPMKKKKSAGVSNKLVSFYEERFPHLNDDELTLMLDSMGQDDIKADLIEYGMSDKQIKELMK